MSIQPPEDWDFEIRCVRLVVDEAALPLSGRVEAVKRIICEGVVVIDRYEGGVWQELFRSPAFHLASGSVWLDPPVYPPVLGETQKVRAARTRATFPVGAYIVLDGNDRGSDLTYPVYSRRSPFIVSTARNVPSEVPS